MIFDNAITQTFFHIQLSPFSIAISIIFKAELAIF
jgi:hypothetical protein